VQKAIAAKREATWQPGLTWTISVKAAALEACRPGSAVRRQVRPKGCPVFLNTGILGLLRLVASAALREAGLEGDGDALRL